MKEKDFKRKFIIEFLIIFFDIFVVLPTLTLKGKKQT